MRKLTTEEKRIRGTYQANKERKPMNLVKSTLINEIPPADDLSDGESEYYYSLCHTLLDRNELTVTNAKEVQVLCQLMTHRDKLMKEITEGGYVVTFSSGASQVSPYISALDKIDHRILLKYKMLGLDSLTSQKIERRLTDVDMVDRNEQQAIKNDLLSKLNAL